MAKVTVLGSGGFGLALAVMMDRFGNDVTVWSAFTQELDDIRRDGENKAKLPGIAVRDSIKLSDDISCIKGSEMVLFGIPSGAVRKVAHLASEYITADMVVVNSGKGLESGTLKLMSEVIHEELPQNDIVVLTGPSHAEEVGIGMPTTVVAACTNIAKAQFVQDVMSNETFRVYINDDVIGCEIGGALKNVIALCAGIVDGMGYGDNTKAALMTRGISEIATLGIAMGAKMQTFAGLTGIGDLIVTCTSMHSRNRRAGILIGKGVSPKEAVELVGTVEGYACTQVSYELAKKMGVNMPITEACNDVLFNNASVKTAIANLMGRPKKFETESIALTYEE